MRDRAVCWASASSASTIFLRTALYLSCSSFCSPLALAKPSFFAYSAATTLSLSAFFDSNDCLSTFASLSKTEAA